MAGNEIIFIKCTKSFLCFHYLIKTTLNNIKYFFRSNYLLEDSSALYTDLPHKLLFFCLQVAGTLNEARANYFSSPMRD